MNTRTRYVQIEITTHCNFGCFYCAGRAMPQRHMTLELFDSILMCLPKQRVAVSLQGEGEPFLHPHFWELVERVRRSGHTPFTITNGSALVDTERVSASFPRIGVSIDTLDPALAERVGRIQLARVLRNIDRLAEHMNPRRIEIYTVDFGQPLDEVKAYVARMRFGHLVQPLQRKDDYTRHYGDRSPVVARTPESTARPDAGRPLRCSYIERDHMRYFNIDGTMMPCCFIKDAREFQSIEVLRSLLAEGTTPAPCAGCAQLMGRGRTGPQLVAGRGSGQGGAAFLAASSITRSRRVPSP